MRIYCIAVITLLLAGCDESVTPDENPPAAVQLEFPDHFDAAWVMSAGWENLMGVALAVTEDRYYYWMYSDVGPAGNFPYTGSYSVEGDKLVLGSPTVLATGKSAEEMTEWGLYSSEWHILREGFIIRLHATTDDPRDHARILCPDFGFNPQNPFANQGHMKAPNQSP